MKAVALVFALVLAACATPSDFSTPCPADKQFCVVDTDGGCEVEQLVCCEGSVPACDGHYEATLPAGCTTVESHHCG